MRQGCDNCNTPVECEDMQLGDKVWCDPCALMFDHTLPTPRKDFTLEKALDFLRGHNDGVYKITASKHLDELVYFLLCWFQRHLSKDETPKREGVKLTQGMVDRFLRWQLPDDFNPDGGITYKAIPHHKPIGTNLLTSTQAEAMLEFILESQKP